MLIEGSIAHGLVHDAGENAAVYYLFPSLVVFIGNEFGRGRLAVPTEFQFEAAGVLPSAAKTQVTGSNGNLRFRYHLSSFLTRPRARGYLIAPFAQSAARSASPPLSGTSLP